MFADRIASLANFLVKLSPMQPTYGHEFDILGLPSNINFRVFTDTEEWQSPGGKKVKNWFSINFMKMVYLSSNNFDSNFNNSAIKVLIILCE